MTQFILLAIPISLILITLILFLVTLMFVNDVAFSLIVILKSLQVAFSKREKDEKIKRFAQRLTIEIKKDLKKLVTKKDEDIASQLSLSIEEAHELKNKALESIRAKDELIISYEDCKLLLESANLLSFWGYYKQSIKMFSREDIQRQIRKMNHEQNKLKKERQVFDNYENEVIIKNMKDKDLFNYA